MIATREQREHVSPSEEIRDGVRQVGRDVVALAELQTELLHVELRQWLDQCSGPALRWGAAAVAAAAGGLPLVLLAAAHTLAQATELSLAAALAAVGGAALALSAICGAVSWRRLRCGRGAFARFRRELARNVRWLADLLSHPAATAHRVAAERHPPKPR